MGMIYEHNAISDLLKFSYCVLMALGCHSLVLYECITIRMHPG